MPFSQSYNGYQPDSQASGLILTRECCEHLSGCKEGWEGLRLGGEVRRPHPTSRDLLTPSSRPLDQCRADLGCRAGAKIPHHYLLPSYWIILISKYIRIFTILKVTLFWFNITFHLTSYFLCFSSWQDFFQELSKLYIKRLFYFLLYLILWGFNNHHSCHQWS